MEVGPLARMLIAYASGHERVKFWVDAVLTATRSPATVLFSTLGRTAARCVETLVLAEQLGTVDDGACGQYCHGRPAHP